jgi:hypothetical protein
MPQQKITLGEMRSSGVRGLLVYCADYKCSHSIKLEGAVVDRWADGIRISDIEPRFICKRCSNRGADINFAPARMGTLAAVRKLLAWISEG